MYSEADMAGINDRIRRCWIVLLPVLALLLGAYVLGLAKGVRWLAMAAGALFTIVACYGLLAQLLPNWRYRKFLGDMREGLSRELKGTIVEISGDAQLQDGAWVLPVRIFVDALQDEHIVYLNASKREMLPGPGTRVTLRLYGRHIREAKVE